MEKSIVSVCYHYLKRNDEFNRIWGHDFSLFKTHVDFLKYNYQSINLKKIDDYLTKCDDLPDNSLIISFDDSLKEQATIIAPYLSKMGMSAMFSISSCVLDGCPLNPQVFHFGMAYYGIRKFVEIIKMIIVKYDINPDSYEVFLEKCPDVMDLHRKIKLFFKYNLSNQLEREVLLDFWNNHLAKDVPDVFSKVYMNEKDIRNLVKHGHDIVVHGNTHTLINDETFNDSLFQFELVEPKKRIERLIGSEVNSFVYPFAKSEDVVYDQGNLKKINDIGFKYLFTIFKEENYNGQLDFNFFGRYSSQSADSVEDLKNNIWEYKI